MAEILEELRWKKFPVLDQGHVALVDAMGSDADICQAARVSYGAGTRSVSDDRTLIRYLMRHRHSTPFEMAEIKLHVRVPMDTWRQWIRHRTANVNEYSTRYSEAIEAMQATPADGWRLQATGNKQGSGGALENWTGEDGGPDLANESEEHALAHQARMAGKLKTDDPLSPGQALSIMERRFQGDAREVYRQRLAMGVAREQARKDLPLSTYTEAYWKCDLRNILGFLALRMDGHAQQEIRSYAEVIGREIVAKLFPLTWEAFEDYTLNAVTLSWPEIAAVRILMATLDLPWDVRAGAFDHIQSRREQDECKAKLERLRIIPGAVDA